LDDAKRAAFREVCAHFQPVFHHFFLEKFTVPAEWYERRVAYTRSVATNSMGWFIFHWPALLNLVTYKLICTVYFSVACVKYVSMSSAVNGRQKSVDI